MCDPPSQDHSPTTHDSRGQTKITDYFFPTSAHTGKRARSPCQLIANSSSAKRLKSGDEEVSNNQNACNSNISLTDSEGAEEDTVSCLLSMEADRSPTSNVSEGDTVSCLLSMETDRSPTSNVSVGDTVSRLLSVETGKSRTSNVSEGDTVSYSLSMETDRFPTSNVSEGDTVSHSLSVESNKSPTSKGSAVHADLSLAEEPQTVATSGATSKVNSSVLKAGFSHERKVGKYSLRSIHKYLEEDTTVTNENRHFAKRNKRSESGDASASADDSDDAQVSSLTLQTTNSMNLEFYRNKVKSVPDGDFIENILTRWKDDFKTLERHHGYIQWLFPLKEVGMNHQAQILLEDEAKAIREDAVLKERVLRAYKMMLGFYGLVLKDEVVGIVGPSGQFQRRMENLNTSFHNNLRITRILKALGEFGFEHLKKPLLVFLITEAFQKNTLVNCRRSCVSFWIPTLKSKDERESLEKMVKDLERKEFRKPPKYYNSYYK